MKNYKETINLLKTSFSMYGNLKEKEPKLLKEWDENKLYDVIRSSQIRKKTFILHDGPPYANGDVHIGHAVNKILKDVLIRSKRMNGFDSPFVLGWDCHGLPIENQVEKNKGKLFNKHHFFEFRKECRKYALYQVERQKSDFKRMGILTNWNRFYMTMEPNLESHSIRTLGKIIKNRHLTRKRKPVYWCIQCQSALAEAELEYLQKCSLSLYVAFKSLNSLDICRRFQKSSPSCLPIYAIIWTTTPWTIPANRAIGVNRDFTYLLVESNNFVFIVAEGLLKSFAKVMNVSKLKILSSCHGSMLESSMFSNPITDFKVPIVLSDHVHLNEGTGLVHIAPGHGLEDYDIGMKYKLEVSNIIDKRGRFVNHVHPILDKLSIFKSDEQITKILEEKNCFFISKNIFHKYPFCWRHNVPLIFRSTTQWFISMHKNHLREKILSKIDSISWYPKWGRERMEEMVQKRPDWCISRQRSWGTPIPIFIHKENNKMHPDTLSFISDISKKVKCFGGEYWWNVSIDEFLKNGDSKKYFKEKDVLDVWFDSGSINYSSINDDFKDYIPDVYLEGSDQYRGWFMSSLILSVAVSNDVPCKTIITHGFVVDKNGKKMSKSIGNVISPKEIINEFGADILRLWVTSSDYSKEINISKEILSGIVDHYRKIRNTIRFLLSNIKDFNIKTDGICFTNMIALDQRILMITKRFQKKIIRYYENYNFHKVINALLTFCSIEMSSEYLNIVKDRQYMNLSNSLSRRSGQTAFFHILSALVRWISPILPFTSYEVWKFLAEDLIKNNLFSDQYYVYLQEISENNVVISMENWDLVFLVKKEVNKVIERKRREKIVNHSMESNVVLYVDSKIAGVLQVLEKELKFLFLVSSVKIMDVENSKCCAMKADLTDLHGLKVEVSRSNGKKCNRCWYYFNIFEGREKKHKFDDLCHRCVLNLLKKEEIRKFV
ncbi:isoleucine--tRNA ligase [Candidatus Riesia pediculischaeffi]|uniref:Isoleucine--tRNA ligase n=1 Tax=Candidatus Riesia pediculischaeffi TaxID=428411 RepID=A0A1V0HJY0_9ENTR|nr:isoleucine--tRNA ligase [Candidatus Riesia pediculischaeffi]ARC53133.1 isoleucine--tRNA ligase [Candidatus Riesia pediculischaeffi]